jgi:hypothetical protein
VIGHALSVAGGSSLHAKPKSIGFWFVHVYSPMPAKLPKSTHAVAHVPWAAAHVAMHVAVFDASSTSTAHAPAWQLVPLLRLLQVPQPPQWAASFAKS